ASSPDAPVPLHTGLARLLSRRGAWREAEDALRRADREGQEDPEYWRALAILDWHEGMAVHAELSEGRAALYDGDTERADRLYSQGLAKADARPAGRAGDDAKAAFTALLDGAERRYDSDAALGVASAAVERWPQEPFFLRRCAELLLE